MTMATFERLEYMNFQPYMEKLRSFNGGEFVLQDHHGRVYLVVGRSKRFSGHTLILFDLYTKSTSFAWDLVDQNKYVIVKYEAAPRRQIF
jgi:hypothetical protein